MTNILIVSEEFLLSTTREVYKKFQYLEGKRLCSVRLVRQGCLSAGDFDWCDIIIAVRSFSDFDLRLAHLAKSKRKLFILYLDDDLLGLAPNYGRYGVGVWPKRQAALLKLLPHIDMLFTCNPLLGKKYAALANNVKYVVINSAIKPDEVFNRVRSVSNNEKVKIVYYVNDGTSKHFDSVICPMLYQAAAKFAGKISLTLMTIRSDLHDLESKVDIKYIPHMEYSKFKEFMKNERFDIGLAPLIPGGFSKFKYFNKYIEYSRYGIAGIYTACEPYTFVINNGINGILCDNNPDAWFEALKNLIIIPNMRMAIVDNAQRQLLNEFAIDKIMGKLVKECPELISYKAPVQKNTQVAVAILHAHRYLAVILECLYFSRIALQKGGLKLFCIRVYRYFKRIFVQKKQERVIQNKYSR